MGSICADLPTQPYGSYGELHPANYKPGYTLYYGTTTWPIHAI
jgi:hypothetical protein